MNWLDKQTWKNCFVATFLCVVGCSIGTMGTLFYLADYNWLYVFVVSFLIGGGSIISQPEESINYLTLQRL